jgi:HEAT repeats
VHPDELNPLNIRAIDYLCQVLRYDRSRHIRLSAIKALSNMGYVNTQAIDTLGLVATTDQDETLRHEAVLALAKICKDTQDFTQFNQFLQLMSDQPKVQMNFNAPVTGAAGSVEGDFIVNVSEQNLAEAAAEIQQLLNQLSTSYPSTYLYEFEQQIPTNTRIRDILIAGGIELIKILCPLAGIPIEMGMKWLETAKR